MPVIRYQYKASSLGLSLIARATNGICYIGFGEEASLLLIDFSKRFKGFVLKEESFDWPIIQKEGEPFLLLELKGTPFQYAVWEKLITVEFGQTTHYGVLAKELGCPKSCRAVGTAVGANPVSFFVPCHRVLPASGGLGEYHWGKSRKQQLLENEKRHES